MEKIKLSQLYGECVPFYNSDLYRSGGLAENLLAQKVLLEFLNPDGLPKVKKLLSLLEETFREEAEHAARYYFACGVKAAENKGNKVTVSDL